MAGSGTRATAQDYNNIQAVISSVMGIGTGTTGYGQPIASSPVSQSTTMTSTQWDQLRDDLTKARVHQTNTGVSTASTTIGSPWQTLFDVTPVEVTESKPLVPTKNNSDELDLKQDLTDAYEQSKSNLQDIIDQGKDAMDEILQIAKAGQHPRAFEVYGTLLKNMVEANDRLLKMQKEMREMDGKKKDNGDTKIDKILVLLLSCSLYQNFVLCWF